MTKGGGIVAYLRVSSASQTSAMQRDAIARAAAARGDVVADWIEDRFTGGGAHPPGLQSLTQGAREGAWSRCYVYRLDRLSRRGIRDLLSIVEGLEGAGVELVSVADGFDLRGPAREVILAVIAWAASMERAAIGERISDARRRVEAKGGSWGRPPRMTEAQIERARALKAKGKSHRKIAATLGIPLSTVARAVIQKPGAKWGPRALAKGKLRRLKKQGIPVDLRKTASRSPGATR